MAQKPPGKTAGSDRVTFTKASAERIADVVRKVEGGDRDGSPFGNSPRLSQPVFRLRLGTFTGAWAVGQYKTVTLKDSTSTMSVYNWCNAASTSTATQHVIFGRVNGTLSVVELPIPTVTAATTSSSTSCMSIGTVNLSTITGFDASKVQMLGHSTSGSAACLTWYSVATCATT